MAKIEFKGIDEYAGRLSILFKDSEKMVRRAVYDGAAIVADEIKAGLNELPTEPSRMGTAENPLIGVTKRQKADLIEAFGLAPIKEENGYVQTKAGVDGYGSVPTESYPNGVPNAMLMRSVESGTSFRKKHPVFRPAVNRARKKAEEKMKQVVEQQLENMFK